MVSDTNVSRKDAADLIDAGKAILGIEFGSTRIKASLISPDSTPLASGSHDWENRLKDGVWTYDLDDVWKGLASCYASLTQDVRAKYSVDLKRLAAAGFSGMMHGYIALDKNDEQLTPFRTWRNNITAQACAELTPLFDFAIPQRWTIAHLYQSILEKQEHVSKIAYLTTLAGYVHWKLTGERVVGAGEGSGIFPIDLDTQDYDASMLKKFDSLIAAHGYGWKLQDILPKVLTAGTWAGSLTPEGAKLLDPSGKLQAGVPHCPPEGDADTGMVATNSVRPKTGNVSAGTSVFAMVVLEEKLKKVHEEIDIITTPEGKLVAMAHSNNGMSDFDAWINLFGQTTKALGLDVRVEDLYAKLTPLALMGESDAGGLLPISYISGEHLTGFTEGRPLFVRKPDSNFSIENFVRSLLFTSLCALKTGMEILTVDEHVAIDEIRGHGGFFKRGETGQRLMAAAMNVPISLPATAGEGGSWGMALLAAYMLRAKKNQSLPDFLDDLIAKSIGAAVKPNAKDVEGFRVFFDRYKLGLTIEAAAVKALR